jgi:oligopeptide/dipeptide ABC transporter ATP-binding protein
LLGGELMLEIQSVDKDYKIGTFGTHDLKAVRQVSFTVQPGEVVSLIGESGSGKSTIGKMVLRLVGTTSGSIRFDGQDVLGLGRRGLREYYRNAQGVFQDPFSSYNPIFKVDRTFDTLHKSYFPRVPAAEWRTRLEDVIASVGLVPSETLGKYPHQLSGGQLQRLLIARALLLDIKLLVADEIISMLDASTRIDVLNLLGDLKARGLGILFITHDLSLGNYVSDKVVILYKGRMVEGGRTSEVFADPLHPYTRALLASVPQHDRKWDDVEAEEARRDASLEGRCLFHEDAPSADEHSLELIEHAPGHQVGCFRMGTDDPCPAQVLVG